MVVVHAWHALLHGRSQHTPSTHRLEAHSGLEAHGVPRPGNPLLELEEEEEEEEVEDTSDDDVPPALLELEAVAEALLEVFAAALEDVLLLPDDAALLLDDAARLDAEVADGLEALLLDARDVEGALEAPLLAPRDDVVAPPLDAVTAPDELPPDCFSGTHEPSTQTLGLSQSASALQRAAGRMPQAADSPINTMAPRTTQRMSTASVVG